MICLLFPCFITVQAPWVHSLHCFRHYLVSSMLITTNSIISLKIPLFLNVPKASMTSLQRKQLSFREGNNKCRSEHYLRALHHKAHWCSKLPEQSIGSRQKEEPPGRTHRNGLSHARWHAHPFYHWGCQSWNNICSICFCAV